MPERAVADRVASAKVTVTYAGLGREHLRELVVPELQERERLCTTGSMELPSRPPEGPDVYSGRP